MDPFGRLKNLFDLDISADNIALVNIEKEEKTIVEGDTAKINISELTDEEREEVIEVTQEQFEEKGRVLREAELEEANDLESIWTEGFQDTVDFFDGIVSSRYVEIINDSLYLRGIIEKKDLNKQQIDKRKRDLGERLGAEAPYISNLCSSGYFDKGREFQTMYIEKFRDGPRKMHKYEEEFQKIIENRLLCTFVERDQTVYEVTQDVRGALAKYQREEPVNDYIDIRGIGFEARDIIDDVVVNLEEEFFALEVWQWGDVDDYVIRIDPMGLPDLGSRYK